MQSWQYLRLNINDYLLKDGQEPMSGPLDMSLNKISNLGNATENGDAVNKSVMDASLNLRILKSGDSMIGPLNMSLNKITNLGNATADGDAVNKSVMDLSLNLRVLKSGDTMIGPLNMSLNKITNLGNAQQDSDAINKSVMDTSLNLRVLKSGDTMTGPLTIMDDASYNGILTLNTGSGSLNRKVDQRFYSTFSSNGDTVSRRTADIVAGFNSTSYTGGTNGVWGSEYLSLNVGNNGNDNDGQLLTSEKVRITASGNVGIGTTTPSQKLHVNGSAIIGSNLGVNGAATITGKVGAGNFHSGTAATINDQGAWIDWNSNAGQGRTAIMNQKGASGGSGGGIQFGESTTGNVRTVNMFLDGSGSLGIGTTTPVQKLHVNGSALIANNLGIGTSSPAQALDVNGNINFTGTLRVNNNSGTSGQILTSQGSSTAPVWSSFSKAYYNITSSVFQFTNLNTNGNWVEKIKDDLTLFPIPINTFASINILGSVTIRVDSGGDIDSILFRCKATSNLIPSEIYYSSPIGWVTGFSRGTNISNNNYSFTFPPIQISRNVTSSTKNFKLAIEFQDNADDSNFITVITTGVIINYDFSPSSGQPASSQI